MSSSEALDRPPDALARACEALTAAVNDPNQIADADLRALIAGIVRLYAAKAENGMRAPLPAGGGGVTITDTMIVVTDLLHALNVQLFELSMWQAMTGNCVAPHHRLDVPQS